MLRDAIISIRRADADASRIRERAIAGRRALSRAEELSAQLEDLLLAGATEIPRPLLRDIRAFITNEQAGAVRAPLDPAPALDLLFDVQELLQARRPRPHESPRPASFVA